MAHSESASSRTAASRLRSLCRAFLILLGALLPAACVPEPVGIVTLDKSVPGILDEAYGDAEYGKDALSRAAPSYIQFLERHSLLRQTPALASIVSGSSLPWNAPSTRSEAAGLLRATPSWFHFNPLYAAWQGRETALDALASGALPAQLSDLGLRGLYLSPLAESGLSWSADTDMSENGLDLVAFTIAPDLGGNEAYARLEAVAARRSLLLGGDALPAATGLGPDFALALRGVREYPGLYMMVDVPKERWEDLPLPRLNDKTEGQILRHPHRAALSEAGLLPPAFSRDFDGELRPSGWAVSSELVGVDGVNRRWVYRFAGSPLRPVLNWDDPSGAARRVLSASIIQQVGLYHQPLIGLSLESLWGQDPTPPTAPMASPEPALSALRALSRETRRYGALSMLRDPFPLASLARLQNMGADFVHDSVLTPNLEYALLSGDTAPLKRALDESLHSGVDHARLWRASPDGSGIDFGMGGLSGEEALSAMFRGGNPYGMMAAPAQAEPDPGPAPGLDPEPDPALDADADTATEDGDAPSPPLSGAGTAPQTNPDANTDAADELTEDDAPPPPVVYEGGRFSRKPDAAWLALLPLRDGTLYATAPTLAAAVNGLSPDEALHPDDKQVRRIADAHLLQIAFRVFMPGLFLLSGQDVRGSLFARRGPDPSLAGWSMDASAPAFTRRGIPADSMAYPPLGVQLADEAYFASRLRRMLTIREQSGVAAGALAARVEMAEKSAVGVLTRLPDGGFMLCAGNFSGKSFVTGVTLPSGTSGTIHDPVMGHNLRRDGNHLRLRMGPREFRVLLIDVDSSRLK